MTIRTATEAMTERWTVEDAAELYQLDAWGEGYFGINAEGHIAVRPRGGTGPEIDLLDVVRGLRERDLEAPVLIRFSDILAHRLRYLHEAFRSAIEENEYRGSHIAVYPVKVNQQRQVVEEVFRFGREFSFGLEVGSKPELLAVMALTGEEADRPIICNGFKDASYIEAVLLATKLGRHIVPVIENAREFDLVLEYAERYAVRPRIGARVKLFSQGSGRWSGSSGERSKFGLFVSELLAVVERLERRDMLDCLTLLHCHPGSQIQQIRRLKDAVAELAHVYGELAELGAGLGYIDVGGGLGVDYDGSRTDYESSMNYTVEEYANEVVYRIGSVCDERGLDHPTIVTESGRAMAAYQSVLVFNVLGITGPGRHEAPEGPDDDPETPQPLRDLGMAYDSVSERRLVDGFHDALQAREEAIHLFKLGYLTLEQRGLAERLFWATCRRVRDLARGLEALPDELQGLEEILSDTYFCNLSVFQSLPDVWAIGQRFPITPIHRLDERPTRAAVLADITCDSDGKIDRFVDVRDVRRTLPLHEPRAGEEYYLAAYLVGAYQETLGDLHNLFGDTHAVHVRLHEGGGWWIEEVVRGDTSGEVLRYVRYDVDRFYPMLHRDCESAVRDGRMTLAESRALLRFYESALGGYTYLQSPTSPERARR